MINWILGGSIIALTVYTVVKSLIRFREGKGICNCECSGGNCCGNGDCK